MDLIKRSSVRAVALLALIVLAMLPQHVRAASIEPRPTSLTKIKNVGGSPAQPGTPDTSSFTVPICAAGASGAMASADTFQAVRTGLSLSLNSNSAGTTTNVNLIRITAWGVPFLVTSDTLKAFVDYGETQWGPWLNASPTTLVNLIVAGGAGAADTVGSAYYKLNVTPLTTLANGGQTAYSGYLTIKTDSTTPSSPLGWSWARVRLAGDCTAPVYVTSVVFAPITDVAAASRTP